MDAENCKIIFLTEPIINSPNEIGIFFNMLRGRIKSYEFLLKHVDNSKFKRLNINSIRKILYSKNSDIDYINYSGNKLTITRNPFKFISRYKQKDDGDIINHSIIRKKDSEFAVFRNTGSYENVFVFNIINALEKNGIQVLNNMYNTCINHNRDTIKKDNQKFKFNNKVCIKKYNCLPDELDSFNSKFINPDTNELINQGIFKRRIMGLTSYLNLPKNLYYPNLMQKRILKKYKPMHDYQLKIYNTIRNKKLIMKKKCMNITLLKKYMKTPAL